MVRSTLASAVPEFVRYSHTSGSPAPTNHMSELGCEQLTRPMPDESACSASNPSAICPVADTELPPPLAPPGAATVVAAPGTATVTGAGAAVPAVEAPLAAVLLPGVALPLADFVATGAAGAAGAASTELTVAEPAAVLAVVADDDACVGTAIMEMFAAPSPGAGGGHDRVTDVTVAA